MTGTLFVLGIALLASAFIGGGLRVSNIVDIPVISTRLGGFGLAFAGVISIALGYQFHYWDTPRDHESNSAGVAPPPLTGNPPGLSALPASTVNHPRTSTPGQNVFTLG